MKVIKRWIFVFLYIVGIFAVTPFLPKLIQIASSKWSSSGIKQFVLQFEIFLVLLVLAFGIGFFIFRRKKTAIILIVSIIALLLLSLLIYQFLPNPYEFTHFPEYAVLSILLIRALDVKRGSDIAKKKSFKTIIRGNLYIQSGFITSLVGTGDEIYQHFLPGRASTWYDLFLNSLGGILGLLIFWAIRKRSDGIIHKNEGEK